MLGWGEFELEVMRDRNDNVVVVCSIENIDPMGVHTGDSVTVAPQQTLSDREYQVLRDQALTVIRAVGVETGGSNIQFAVDPAERRRRRDRDEPARLALVGARVEGDGLPDREDRGPARRRLCAGGDPERHHASHAGFVRADDRLRGRKDAALRLREVPGRRGRPHDPDEERRRGDGDRPYVQAGLHEGDALARARHRSRGPGGHRRACSTRLEEPSHDRYELLFAALRRGVSIEELRCAHRDQPLVPAPVRGARRGRESGKGTSRDRSSSGSPTTRSGSTARERIGQRASRPPTSRSTPARPSSRPRRPTSTPPTRARRGERSSSEVRRGSRPSVVILGSGPEPDRPGDRVRLLLRPRRDERSASWGATR